jgi:hypothetical protein
MLSADEIQIVSRLTAKHSASVVADQLYDQYFEGEQALRRLGIAVPPELTQLVTLVNWPRLVVEAIEERCDVKSFIRPGADVADDGLREGWDENNLDSEFHQTLTDALVNGRGVLSVGTNEDDDEHPIIAVEPPQQIAFDMDVRRRRVRAALKLYRDEPFDIYMQGPTLPTKATLYMPDATVWLEKPEGGLWVEVDRDDHRLGRVPVFPFFNRRRSKAFVGVSEIDDAISLTDAAARALTNLQVAAETHAVPQRYALGVSKGDFVDSDGDPLPVWKAYFGAIWSHSDNSAKVGQFAASDLRNFHETVNHYAGLLAGQYGLPMRYMGQNTANPPSADGIRADEARLVKRAERKMSAWGDQLGRVMATYERFRTGDWPESGARIAVEWHDAATPTYAAKVDGVQKLTGGSPLLSREGGWDELGWTSARKDRERAYFERQDTDPVLERLARDLDDVGT